MLKAKVLLGKSHRISTRSTNSSLSKAKGWCEQTMNINVEGKGSPGKVTQDFHQKHKFITVEGKGMPRKASYTRTCLRLLKTKRFLERYAPVAIKRKGVHKEVQTHLSLLKAKDLRERYISCSCCSSLQLEFSTARLTLLE